MDTQQRRNAEADLRATSDDLVADARRIVDLEHLKAGLDPTDPRMAGLAAESVRVATGMASKARMEPFLRRQAEAEPAN